MPGKPLLFDLRCRPDTICRSCLSSLRRRPPSPWAASFTTQPAQRARSRIYAQPRKPAGKATKGASQAEWQQFFDSFDEHGPGKPDDYTVNYFEQEGDVRRPLKNEDAFNESFDGVTELGTTEFLDFMEGMKSSARTEDEKDAFGEVFSQLGPVLSKVRTSKDLEKFIEKLVEQKSRIKDEINRETASLPEELGAELRKEMAPLLDDHDQETSGSFASSPKIPEKPWTANQRRKIARLNSILSKVWRDTHGTGRFPESPEQGKVVIPAVYKAYHAARLALSRSWSTVPLDVWDFLWEVLSTDELHNANRLNHVALLARDMSEAKATLSPSQQLLTIEAVFMDGWEKKAIDNWKRCISSLGDEGAESFKAFWELGVRMHCRMGEMDQTERAVSKLLQQGQGDPRILMPIIRTCSEAGTQQSQERAWSAYRQMRGLLGRHMKLEDYDEVIASFLTTNQMENALYAFVDMMSDGEIDMKQQKKLPSVIANKFFLGKWLKRLIGAGDLDGAYSVVEFMRNRGVSAAPIHLNGLIGAWQRSGSAKNLTKADELAWGMIESRVNFVRARKGESKEGSDIARRSSIIPLPRATLETFSLLAENYRVRGLHEQLIALWDAFHDAEMNADAFILNQLLESHIRAGQWKEAAAFYDLFVHEKGVTPDPFTFSAMWKTLGVNRLHRITKGSMDSGIEEARRLFAEIVKFKDIFMPKGMDGQLARKILHSFRKLEDQGGFLIALTALKDVFKFFPTEILAMELAIGSTKILWEIPSHRRRLLATKREMDRSLGEWANGDAANLEDGNNRGQALYEYLQKKFWLSTGDVEAERGYLADVAKQMGVYDLLDNRREGGTRR